MTQKWGLHGAANIFVHHLRQRCFDLHIKKLLEADSRDVIDLCNQETTLLLRTANWIVKAVHKQANFDFELESLAVDGITENDGVLDYPARSMTNVIPGIPKSVEELVDLQFHAIPFPRKKLHYARKEKC